MLVTLSGMSTEITAVQPEKAARPMLFTLLGIVTEVRLEQPLKALSPMHVTPSGMVTLLMVLSLTPSRMVPDSSNMKMLSFMVELIIVATKL